VAEDCRILLGAGREGSRDAEQHGLVDGALVLRGMMMSKRCSEPEHLPDKRDQELESASRQQCDMYCRLTQCGESTDG